MIERLFEWAASGHGAVKLCISSREWNIFLDAFATCPKLRLHDMRLLVSGRLAANKHCQARLLRDPENVEFLESQIVEKAEGVFLWVYLVLNVVEEILGDGGDAQDLRATLDSLPSDLEKLFKKLLASISPANTPTALQTFMAVLQAVQGGVDLVLYRYPFLAKYHKDKDFALKMAVAPWGLDQVTEQLSLARRRLGCCKCFLEIREFENRDGMLPFRDYITISHRSLATFLRQKCASISTVDSRDALLQLFPAQVKTTALDTPYFQRTCRSNHFVKELEYLLAFAFDHRYSLDAKRLSLVLNQLRGVVGITYWAEDQVLRDDRFPTVINP